MTLNVSPTSEDDGARTLGVEVSARRELGDSFDPVTDQCHWDAAVTYDDGDTGDWRNINLCETTTITLT